MNDHNKTEDTVAAGEPDILQGDHSEYDENDNYDENNPKNSHRSIVLSKQVSMRVFLLALCLYVISSLLTVSAHRTLLG